MYYVYAPPADYDESGKFRKFDNLQAVEAFIEEEMLRGFQSDFDLRPSSFNVIEGIEYKVREKEKITKIQVSRI